MFVLACLLSVQSVGVSACEPRCGHANMVAGQGDCTTLPISCLLSCRCCANNILWHGPVWCWPLWSRHRCVLAGLLVFVWILPPARVHNCACCSHAAVASVTHAVTATAGQQLQHQSCAGLFLLDSLHVVCICLCSRQHNGERPGADDSWHCCAVQRHAGVSSAGHDDHPVCTAPEPRYDHRGRGRSAVYVASTCECVNWAVLHTCHATASQFQLVCKGCRTRVITLCVLLLPPHGVTLRAAGAYDCRHCWEQPDSCAVGARQG